MPSKLNIHRKFRSLMSRSTPELRIKIRASLDLMRKAILKEMRQKFMKDRAKRIAEGIIDWEALGAQQETLLKKTIMDIMDKAGGIAFGIKKQIEAGFDILNVEAVRIAEDITSELIKQIGDEARKNIKYLIREGIKEGKTMHEIAMGIRLEQLGITFRDLKASANYEEWLLINRPELGAKEIERRIRVYEARKYRKRCALIARTETARAVSEGSILGYKQSGVNKVEFIASADACEECADLDGKIYSIGEVSGILPVHPACRCTYAPVI